LITRKSIAAGAVIGGLGLLFLAVFIDVTMEDHTKAIVAGGVGAVLLLFATAYHVILPRQRGHRERDRAPRW
jgi:hypothetical protein